MRIYTKFQQKSIYSIFLFLFFLSISGFSQIKSPVKWSYSVNQNSVESAELIITAKIDKGWHLYSQYMDEGGPIVTSFKFNKSKAYKLDGKTSEPKPQAEFDDMFKMTVKYFNTKAVFKQKIKILCDKDFTVKGGFEYMVCNDGSCIPFQDNSFEFKVKGNPNANEIIAKDTSTTASSTIQDNKTFDTTQLKKDTTKIAIKVENNKPLNTNGKPLYMIFLAAFLAGILTLITPCVFPMIPMTISFFMKGNKNRKKGLQQAYFFGFSIVMIFGGLGLLLTLLLGKDAMYIISTHWIPNLLFFIIFMVFALSFFGLFELTLPSSLINKSDQNADKGGYLGTFFVAFTTVLVSFSCTGPILGAALIELSSGSNDSMVFLISMIGFALGFAIPFTLLAMFPSVLSKLKSGSWLNTVKIVFGFLEIALGLKFLSMADLGANWGLLDRETFLSLWIVVFALLGFYLLGKLKFKGDNDIERISVQRLMLSIVTFSFVIYMIPGLWGAPLKVLSGYVPPLTTQDFDINRLLVENGGKTSHTSDLGERKYTEKLHLPTGFEGFFDLNEAKAYAKKVNKPIFVDFTGKTCANCREMEANVWNALDVKKILTENYVMVALYADANFIDLPENEWITTKEGKVIKKLGTKNLNYQITRFNMNAQPYYVLMDWNENVLTKENKAYDKTVANFVKFLNEGLEAYKKQNK
ncbi:MAG: thioredoxin family protein [Bacteroidetes bacterium]|nr:thioredoxin family protein [Bacteroidota bacterium]